jgi:hypothetical protein
VANLYQITAKIDQYHILPESTYNMDEKGFLIGILQSTKRYFTSSDYKSGRLKGAGQDGNREWITIIASICQSGTALPPTVIYAAAQNNIQDIWVEQITTTECEIHFTTSPTGWTIDELGYLWLTGVFDRHTKEKATGGLRWRLLYVDGHSSHLNMRFLDYCLDHRILVVAYPPHSTHRLQPLDVSLFNPLANYYSQNLNTWLYKSRGITRMSKRYFYELFWPAYQQAFTKANIESGWRKTGLYPLDPEVILNQVKRIEARPPSNTSSNSTIPEHDWKRLDHQIKHAIGPIITSEAKKLQKSVDNLCAAFAVQSIEIEHLKEQLRLNKRSHTRARDLFAELRAQDDCQALIMSPQKLQAVKALLQQRDQEREAEEALKEQRKVDRSLKKAIKERELQQRKEAREKAKAERKAIKATEQQVKQARVEQRQVERQLCQEAQNTKRSRKPRSTARKAIVKLPEAPQGLPEVQTVELAPSRSGRARRAPQRL